MTSGIKFPVHSVKSSLNRGEHFYMAGGVGVGPVHCITNPL